MFASMMNFVWRAFEHMQQKSRCINQKTFFFWTKDIVKGGIEKSVPWDHHLSSLGTPCDAER